LILSNRLFSNNLEIYDNRSFKDTHNFQSISINFQESANSINEVSLFIISKEIINSHIKTHHNNNTVS